jgi:hypothetical protein
MKTQHFSVEDIHTPQLTGASSFYFGHQGYEGAPEAWLEIAGQR